MNEREQKLAALGYPLERQAPKSTTIEPAVIIGRLIYTSGQVPFDGDKLSSRGKVPSLISVDDATKAAALCTANILRNLRLMLGSLDRIERVVRVTGYVNADPDFTECHLVINGATKLLHEVFGEAGRHARSALGMAQLPLGASVEIEMVLELKA